MDNVRMLRCIREHLESRYMYYVFTQRAQTHATFMKFCDAFI